MELDVRGEISFSIEFDPLQAAQMRWDSGE
jgi:hypothetical protein